MSLSSLTALAAGVTVIAWGVDARALELSSARDPASSACPETAVLRAMVSERLGRDPFSAQAAGGQVSVSFTTVIEEGGVEERAARVRVEAAGEEPTERTLRSPGRDCRVLAETVATTIALLVEDLPVAAAPALEEPPSAASPAPSTASPWRGDRPFEPEPERRSPTPSPGGDAFWFAGIDGQVSLGAAPAPSAGVGVWAGYRHHAWSVRALGRAGLPASGTGSSGFEIETQLLMAGIAPCLHARALELCPVLGLASLRAEGGANVAGRARGHAALGVLGARLGVRLPVSGAVAFVVAADALAPLPRTRLQVGPSEVWALAPVVISLSAGIELRP